MRKNNYIKASIVIILAFCFVLTLTYASAYAYADNNFCEQQKYNRNWNDAEFGTDAVMRNLY